MKRWLVLSILVVASARADVGAPLILDFEVVDHGKTFVVRNDAYEMTFANRPLAVPQNQPFAGGRMAHGAVLTDSPIKGGGDAGQGAVTVTILPVPTGVLFDGDKGADGTRDAVLAALGHVDKSETTPATFGGLRGREVQASGVLNTTPWRFRMFVAWDAPRRTLISIFAIFAPAAPKNAPALLDAFLKAFKSKPAP